ncbi:MAG: hypothetical protein WCW52_03030 [Elusimicrobiales bacterium]|jgi:hypothetical protein
MEENNKMEKPLHKIRSQCTSLKTIAEMFKTCTLEKKLELLALMKEAGQDIMDCLSRLEKDLKG